MEGDWTPETGRQRAKMGLQPFEGWIWVLLTAKEPKTAVWAKFWPVEAGSGVAGPGQALFTAVIANLSAVSGLFVPGWKVLQVARQGGVVGPAAKLVSGSQDGGRPPLINKDHG